jgi:hypothetical protein
MSVSMCLLMLRGKEKAKAVVMGPYEMALGDYCDHDDHGATNK